MSHSVLQVLQGIWYLLQLLNSVIIVQKQPQTQINGHDLCANKIVFIKTGLRPDLAHQL